MTEKFIRTFYNDEKVIMKLNGCQYCPLMRFDMDKSKCNCRMFFNEMQDSTVDVFVINYTDKGVVQDRIKIPRWCLLSDSIEDLLKNRTTYRAFPSSVLINEEDDCDDNKLEFIDAEKLRNEEDIIMENFMAQLSQRPANFNPEEFIDGEVDIHRDFTNQFNARNFSSIEADAEKYGFQIPNKKQEVCSVCGEEDESVKRNNNIGMCDDCWDTYQDDEEKKKQAFINNFRMKRNKDFPKQSFKIVDEINIK